MFLFLGNSFIVSTFQKIQLPVATHLEVSKLNFFVTPLF